MAAAEAGSRRWRHAVANATPRPEGREHGNKHPATRETWGVARTESTLVMRPNADPPKAPELRPGSKPDAQDDLKSLPLP